MLNRPRRVLGVTVVAMLAAVGLPQVSQAASTTSTYVTMVSEQGDSIGGGASRIWRTGSGTVEVTGSLDNQVVVEVDGGSSGDKFRMSFAAAPGDSLAPGTYENAEKTWSRSPGRPGIDVSGEGRSCEDLTGRFTVLDVAPDLSRLHLVYEQGCGTGEHAAFGEISYQMASVEPGLLMAASRVDWPAEHPEVGGRPVPVRLVNTGTEPVEVSHAVVDGADFSLVSNSCTTIAIGGSCTVYVGFVPTNTGARTGTLTIQDSTSAGTRSVKLLGRGLAGHTSWRMHSEDGDYIGQGKDWAYEPRAATIQASGNESKVSLRVRSFGDDWIATFATDSGHLLLPGTTFTGATREPFNSPETPGMSVRGNGRGCNALSGSFTVHDASYDGGILTGISLTFEQLCDDSPGALHGSIAWRASSPAPPVSGGDSVAPPAVSGLTAEAGSGKARLSWTNPIVSDWVETIVRGKTGAVAPETVTQGATYFSGRTPSALLEGLDAGKDYSFSVFPRDRDGNIGAPVSVSLQGTALSLSADSSTLTHGSLVTLNGDLVESTSGSAVPDAVVTIERQDGSGDWTVLDTVTTDAQGRLAFEDRPSQNGSYRLSWAGQGTRLGVVSEPTSVKVSPLVSLTRTATRAGGTKLVTRVSPRHPGQRVVLQISDGRGRRSVERRALSDTSRTAFRVERPSRGAATYRVRKPADGDHAGAVSRAITVRAR